MNRRRNLFRRNHAPSIIEGTLTREVELECGETNVTGIACVPQHELVAVSTWEGVYVYDYTTQGEPSRVFNQHKAQVFGVVHLFDDIMASVDGDGILLTWRAGTGAVLDQLRVSEGESKSITKASATELLVGSADGGISMVQHNHGTSLNLNKLCTSETMGSIKAVSAYNDIFVALSNRKAEVWNYSTGQLLDSIENEGRLNCVAVSQDLIALGTNDHKIYVHQTHSGFDILRTINVSPSSYYIRDIAFLNTEYVMVTTSMAKILFYSVKTGQCLSDCSPDNPKPLYRAAVLGNGRVCVGGFFGYCAILKPPQEVEVFLDEYALRLRSSLFADVPFFDPPLKHIFNGVLEESLPIAGALELVVDWKFHARSIEEWTFAHFIVMAAVKSGDVPMSRVYNGDQIYWWTHLYKLASLIEMGSADRRKVLKFIIEAEEIGILGRGCGEMFLETTEIRSEVNRLSNTIIDLYTRQIVMNEQIRSILNYRTVQQAMSLVNAILACISLAGGAAVHVLSGGLAILESDDGEGFTMDVLAESMAGKVQSTVVEWFLYAGGRVLEEEIWSRIPEANRHAVEASLVELGLSLDELRARIRLAAPQEISASLEVTSQETDEEEVDTIYGSEIAEILDAKELLNTLSKSGLSEDKKNELSEMAWKVWRGWKVNEEDIEFVRKRNGDRQRIGRGGAGDVFLARMKLRDENNVLIPEKHKEVAVKRFTVHRSRSKAVLPTFMRELFLQKNAQHPCIVETLGGHWPDPKNGNEDDELEPFIVMELMSCTLFHVQYKKLLESMDAKVSVLGDVAAGIAHLHSHGIVHRDIKPDNVLIRVEDGKIIGRAKVCDFGVSRKAEATAPGSINSYTRPTGTKLYMPPEAFSNLAQAGSIRARDIWSFGVLMCDVLVPDFLVNILRKQPEGEHGCTGSEKFAKEVAETVRNISWVGPLRDLAVSCLSLDPKSRPDIAHVLAILSNGGV